MKYVCYISFRIGCEEVLEAQRNSEKQRGSNEEGTH